ncbi:glycosyltransferase [Verrucomicrobium spinosum]|uniref:glycosyltransferase n=1 Tax=Verrucomicrobium spinosum TaxID=2736 RepID=UPI0001745BC9|nr:glycosyltransferase [Verrucomicrobium spinosum]
MMTNTYLPLVGGVARSVSTFAEEYRKQRHKVLVVAPTFEGRPPPKRYESYVERVPAIQNFNGSDFSVCLPMAGALNERLDSFQADIIHAHHPFLLGATALRVGASKNVPVVFTHHTRYEDYTHYVPFDSPAFREVAVNLSTQFANLCDGVIAPSESIATMIKERGVESPVKVVPTGIDIKAFSSGDGRGMRKKLKIPDDAFVVGHLGRLAAEKNLEYLAGAVGIFLKINPGARFLVVGSGPAEETVRAALTREGVADRLHLAGKLTGPRLAAAYHAMDVFAFASMSETQGLVLAEAMAAGLPVVALDAPGAREVLKDGVNGIQLPADAEVQTFAKALTQLHDDPAMRETCAMAARETANVFSKERCAKMALDFYAEVRRGTLRQRKEIEQSPWGTLVERLGVEWRLITERADAVVSALMV